ncbi:hypothetical protein K469DRAFT_356339 [Zopfia rhizophila CBS 207.26]|uniref:Biotrophy-associated secreted protein 2 n=1 Tax=Zopfia rhizophila CBS 207.26 TaxID=1314779 RepID=A0A6A6DDW0_9PEZI|nr:hypothetical protein K469DRAFT_356339 [Zopfia rhizophila CBS 207.26]
MAPLFKIAALLNLSLLVASQGTQFITGPCQSDADCASGCCGFNTGKCAGAVVAQERDGGCGFGNAQPNADAAVALGSSGQVGGGGNAGENSQAQGEAAEAPAANAGNNGQEAAAGNNSEGNGAGTQFITGPCQSDADCGSGCCGFNTGKCAGAVVAQERDGGCGFGNAQPNADAAIALGFTGAAGGGGAGNAGENAQAQGENAQGENAPAAGGNAGAGAGNGQGTQFITGPCQSDADCNSGCCGFNTGKCAGAIVAQERDGGCGFGDAEPNDNAAQALRGQRLGKRGVVYWM